MLLILSGLVVIAAVVSALIEWYQFRKLQRRIDEDNAGPHGQLPFQLADENILTLRAPLEQAVGTQKAQAPI